MTEKCVMLHPPPLPSRVGGTSLQTPRWEGRQFSNRNQSPQAHPVPQASLVLCLFLHTPCWLTVRSDAQLNFTTARGNCRLLITYCCKAVSAFVCSGCCNKIPQTRLFQQQKFTFSHFWRLEGPDQDAGRAGFFWGLFLWLADGHLLTVSSHGLYLCSHAWHLWVLDQGPP